MTFLEQYFDGHLFCINLARREDRWSHACDQFRKLGLTTVQRFPAYANVMADGKVNGNAGCTASHRALLEIIAFNGWKRVLILEDDFTAIRPETCQQEFAEMLPSIPEEWDMLYLGGHYAEEPISRVNKHVIRCGRMLTTSSYGITCDFARKIAPYISGIGPIDTLYGGFHRDNKCYILQPRLMVQYTNYSDIMEKECKNDWAMTDTGLEKLV